MKTPREKELELEIKNLNEAYLELEDRYHQLCGRLKRNANDTRNTEDNSFLTTYGRNGRGYWE
jgi:predicted transcriptional regulator